MERTGEPVSVVREDPNDNAILECASGSHYIVSGIITCLISEAAGEFLS
jgi:hypothetical protein